MIIYKDKLCIDEKNPLSCPLQPVMVLPAAGIANRAVLTRQPCVTNCAQFELNETDVFLHCCARLIHDVKIINTEGN